MKFLVTVLLVVILAVSVLGEPKHGKHGKSKHTKAEETGAQSADSETWPMPNSVANFGIPEGFTMNGGSTDGEKSGKTGKHHKTG